MNKKLTKLAQLVAEGLNENNTQPYAVSCWKELQKTSGTSKLDGFIEQVRCYRANRKSQVPVKIISARDLTASETNQILKRLKNKFTEEIIPEYYIDPKIIGGIVVKSKDRIIDLSWKGKIDQLNTKLVGAYE